jgi:hypothetical protein
MIQEPDLTKLRKLYPGLTDEELKDAHRRLVKYLEIAMRVAKQLEQDPVAMADFKRRMKVSRWEAWARERRSCSLFYRYPYPLPGRCSLRS